MQKPELINEIRALLFKNKELEASKTQAIRENLKTKTTDLDEYKRLLKEAKGMREQSRIERSSFQSKRL